MAQHQGEAAASGASEHWVGSETCSRLATGSFSARVPGLRLLLSRSRRDWSKDAGTSGEVDGPEARRYMTSNKPFDRTSESMVAFAKVRSIRSPPFGCDPQPGSRWRQGRRMGPREEGTGEAGMRGVVCKSSAASNSRGRVVVAEVDDQPGNQVRRHLVSTFY